MTRSLHLRPHFAMAAAATLAMSGAAFAQSADSEPGVSVTVRYADLNLATPDGQARIMSRIDAAAAEACSHAAGDPRLDRQALYRQCKAGAVRAGVERLKAVEGGQMADSQVLQLVRR